MIETLLASGAIVGGRWLTREWLPRRRVAKATPGHLREALARLDEAQRDVQPAPDSRTPHVDLDPRAALIRPGQTILGDDLSPVSPYRPARVCTCWWLGRRMLTRSERRAASCCATGWSTSARSG
jgi:hypothetical protein